MSSHSQRTLPRNSKTRSWDGFVNSTLGGAKTISDGKIVVDRDINGARGILLRTLYGNLGREQKAGFTCCVLN
jgi:transposase